MQLHEARIEPNGKAGPLVCHVTPRHIAERKLAEGKERTALVVTPEKFVINHSNPDATTDLLDHLAANPGKYTISLHQLSEGNLYDTDIHGYPYFCDANDNNKNNKGNDMTNNFQGDELQSIDTMHRIHIACKTNSSWQVMTSIAIAGTSIEAHALIPVGEDVDTLAAVPLPEHSLTSSIMHTN